MKKFLLIVFLCLLLCGNTYAIFEIIGKSTVKNVEKCINNSSKLLDKDDNETRCVVKFQKKISKDITKGTAVHYEDSSKIRLEASIKNTSTDIVITGLQIEYEFKGIYDEEFGTINLKIDFNGDPKLDKYADYNYWIQPGEKEYFYFTIQRYENCEHVPNAMMYISGQNVFCNKDKTIKAKKELKFATDTKVNFSNKNFKYEKKKIKDKWSWSITEVYGVYIK